MAIASCILEFIDGPDRGRTARISNVGRTLVGRGVDVDIRLPAVDSVVSRHQAYIHLSGDGCVLTPIEGANPIIDVNHARLMASRSLEDRDIVRVGSSVLRVGLTLTDSTCVLCGKSVDESAATAHDDNADISARAHEACVDRLEWSRVVVEGGEVGGPINESAATPRYLYERSTQRMWAIRWLQRGCAEPQSADMQALLAIRHPQIMRCVRVGEEGEALYVVTELAREGSLADHANRSDRRARTMLPLIDDVLEAVMFLHALGRAHGNVHPHSIVVQREVRGSGSRARAKLVDIGVSGRVRAEIPSATTLKWYPPERALATCDARDDVYAIGMVLSFVLCNPPDHCTFSPSRLEQRVDAIVQRARHPDPARRFGSAVQLRNALREVLR